MSLETVRIVANGEQQDIRLPCTALEFISSHGWKPTQVVVELNGNVLARKELAMIQLKAGDTLEVILPVAGG